MKLSRGFWAVLALALFAAGCGSGEDDSFVRQATLGEPGGVIEAEYKIPEFRLLKPEYVASDFLVEIRDAPKPLYPSKELLEILAWLEKGVGRIPVMMQLPVAWTPEGVLAGGRDVSKSKEVRQQRARIGTAAKAVQQLLFADRDYAESWIDYSEFERLYLKWQGSESAAVVNPDSMKPTSSSKLSTGAGRGLFRSPSLRSYRPSDRDSSVRLVAGDYFTSLSPVPGVRALVTVEELQTLYDKGLIVAFDIDGVEFPDLVDSASDALIGSDSMSSLWGVDGTGTTVAILDTGVYLNHLAFAGRIVSQACYTNDNSCPGGSNASTAAGSGAACTGPKTDVDTGAITGWPCDHGTHVAGIAVGSWVPSGPVPGNNTAAPPEGWHSGVAPGANLLAIRIANNNGGANPSNYVLAWNRVAALANTLNIVSANLSFGPTNSPATAPCDGTWAEGVTAISNLVSVNVAPTKSSGNDWWVDAVGSTACISNYITVGNTTKNDTVSNSSNFRASLLDLQAPGTGIVAASGVSGIPGQPQAGPLGSPAQGSTEFESKTGTSMAAPQVAGAWALARQLLPNANVATIRNLFRATGVLVADNRVCAGGVICSSGLAVPRLDLQAAFPQYSGLGTLPSQVEFYSGSRRTYSEGTGLAKKPTGPGAIISQWEGTINLKDSPVKTSSAGSREFAYLYFSTRGAPANAVEVAGTWYWSGQDEFQPLSASATPCRDLGPLRSYRIDMSANQAGLVKGNNSVKIQVASPNGVADGASILLIGRQRRGSQGGVVLAHGASVLDANNVATAALPADITMDNSSIRLHVGIGDGQKYAYESGILFRSSNNFLGTVVTPPSMFSGTDGPNWDDITFNLTNSGLSGKPGLAVISHAGAKNTTTLDCLGWVYAALNVYPGPLRLLKEIAGTKTVPEGWGKIPKGLDPVDFQPQWDFGEFAYPDPDLIPFKPQDPGPWPPIPD
jgi:subtilisin family serine protease